MSSDIASRRRDESSGRGNVLLGIVPVRAEKAGDFVSLESVAKLIECSVSIKGDSLFLSKDGKSLEFVSDAAVARLNGQIQPLRHPPLVRDGTWWGEAQGTLVLLNRFLGLSGGATGLRWAGTGTVEEEKPLAPSPVVQPEACRRSAFPGFGGMEKRIGYEDASPSESRRRERPPPPVAEWSASAGGGRETAFGLSSISFRTSLPWFPARGIRWKSVFQESSPGRSRAGRPPTERSFPSRSPGAARISSVFFHDLPERGRFPR
jgi:hypothetical protein